MEPFERDPMRKSSEGGTVAGKKPELVEEQISLRRRLPAFAAIEHAVIDDWRLSGSALLVYLAMVRFCDHNNRQAQPTLRLIAKTARLGRTLAYETIAELRRYGYLTVLRSERGKPVEYLIGLPEASETRPEAADGSENTRPAAPDGTRSQAPDGLNETRPAAPDGTRPAAPDALIIRREEQEERDALLLHLASEGERSGIGSAWMTPAWKRGLISNLDAGIAPTAIAAAFRSLLAEAPDRIAFFPQDFAHWSKKSVSWKAGHPGYNPQICPSCSQQYFGSVCLRCGWEKGRHAAAG